MPSDTNNKRHSSSKHGFTLVELSIVLVIIGLIAGGVLVGQDLIKAAGIRATISQNEQFNTAIGTFKLKYNSYLPGDMPNATASQLGFSGGGDGDGLIRQFDSNGSTIDGCMLVDSNGVQTSGEDTIFWRHLSDAGMVSFKSNLNFSSVSEAYPAAKLGSGFYLRPCKPSALPDNYFQLISASGLYMTSNLSASDAFNMDKKIDDGMPNSGIVKVLTAGVDSNGSNGGDNGILSWAASATSGNCLYGGTSAADTAAQYNIAQSQAGMCQGIMFKFQ